MTNTQTVLPRVLIAHNAYQHRGGEDAVMEAELALLRERGHAVELYRRDNAELDSMGRASAALQAVWSSRCERDVEALIDSFRPDIIHVHNTVPLISPSIYWVAARRGVAVVQTLHNFRLLCPQALLLREQRICEDCVGKVPWRGVMHGCYRGSRMQTAVLALTNTAHRWAGTWAEKVTRYIALNDFAKRKYIEGGLPADRIRIKANFVDLPPPSTHVPREGALFVGRLSSEKGIACLLEMAILLPPGCRLSVIGDGPMQAQVMGEPRINYLGAQPGEQVYAQMRRARLLLLPSLCYENFPRTLVEAYACGLPVLASDLGALRELVREGETGMRVPPGDARAWAQRVAQALLAPPQELERMGAAARRRYEAELSADANYINLLGIYREAMHAARDGRP